MVKTTKPEDMTPSDAQEVLVEWEDITGLENWNEDDGPFQPISIVSVGWLIEDSPRWLTLARDYDYTNEKWAAIVVIPKLPPVVHILQKSSHRNTMPPVMSYGLVPQIDEATQEERSALNPNRVEADQFHTDAAAASSTWEP